MNIVVIGTGYVGLVTGACFAEFGNHVTCVDIDKQKIEQLKQGILPIYEPGLEELVLKNQSASRLRFACSLNEAPTHPDVIFIAVGTPSQADGKADVQYVLQAARDIGMHLEHACVIVDKSTVPVGVGACVTETIRQTLEERHKAIPFHVVSNPEFLREGAAIKDFVYPDRVIIGLSSPQAKKIMLDLYLPIMRSEEKIYFMSVKDAEMTKYAANAMLATRISFMNEIALICDGMGVDIENVRIGIGSDHRIGSAFLNAGCGYGGSCFPKDVRALVRLAEEWNIDPIVLKSVQKRNEFQKQVIVQKIEACFGGELSSYRFAIWGLAFKPGTDDLRDAPSLIIIKELLKRGAVICAYDPVAMPVARRILPDTPALHFADNQYDAVQDADALILVTEWQEFTYPDWKRIVKNMKGRVIVDGRNQFPLQKVKEMGFVYHGIGRGESVLEPV